MRVLHVNYEFPGTTANCGGGGRVTALLDEWLPQHGIESRVVTDDADGHWSTFPARALPKVRRAIRDFEPDILHGHFALPSSAGLPLLAWEHDLPLIVSVMGADIYDPSRFQSLRWASDRVVGRILDSSDAVVAPSEDMVSRTEARHDVDVRRIPYGIDASRWRWRAREPPESPTVLTVARQVERKRLQRGVHAIDELRHRGYPEARYRLVGDGPQHDLLAGIAADCTWIDVPGYVDDLQAEMDRADLFLLPSDHEAFGIVLLEALACGLPVVTTETGGQTDVVSDDVGATAAPYNVDLAEKMAYVLEQYSEFQQATQDYVPQWYSADAMAGEYARLYRELRE